MVSIKTLLGAITMAISIQSGSAIILTISLNAVLGTVAGCISAAGAVTGGVAAAVSAGKSKRVVDQIEAVPISRVKRQSYGTEYDWDQCHNQLTDSTIDFKGEAPGSK